MGRTCRPRRTPPKTPVPRRRHRRPALRRTGLFIGAYLCEARRRRGERTTTTGTKTRATERRRDLRHGGSERFFFVVCCSLGRSVHPERSSGAPGSGERRDASANPPARHEPARKKNGEVRGKGDNRVRERSPHQRNECKRHTGDKPSVHPSGQADRGTLARKILAPQTKRSPLLRSRRGHQTSTAQKSRAHAHCIRPFASKAEAHGSVCPGPSCGVRPSLALRARIFNVREGNSHKRFANSPGEVRARTDSRTSEPTSPPPSLPREGETARAGGSNSR